MAPSPILFPPFLDFLNDQETLLAFLATIVLILLTGKSKPKTQIQTKGKGDGRADGELTLARLVGLNRDLA